MKMESKRGRRDRVQIAGDSSLCLVRAANPQGLASQQGAGSTRSRVECAWLQPVLAADAYVRRDRGSGHQQAKEQRDKARRPDP